MNDKEKILHLLRRTRFGTSKSEVESYLSTPIKDIVDQILNAPATSPNPNVDLTYQNGNEELIFWWYNEIITTANPFLEKMTLFWHNHFTSSLTSVSPVYMAEQNQFLRSHALGNFKTFLYEVSIEPAMMIYLNNRSNVKKAPNENYARELMELFTVGVENYNQDDVKNVAKSLTGWRLNSESETVYFDRNLFDDSFKTVFRKRGDYDLNDIIRILTSTRECANFIVKKVWNKFVFPNPAEQDIKPFADRFFDSGYDIKALFRDIFLSDAFYSDKALRSIVKDPTEYITDLIRKVPTYEFSINDLYLVNQMGMTLFKPPNVAGWKGGNWWLSASYLFARGNYAEKICNTATYEKLGLDKSTGTAAVDQILDYTGYYDVSPTTRNALNDYANGQNDPMQLLRGLLYLIYVSPEAQYT